jgi:hypothetical protein
MTNVNSSFGATNAFIGCTSLTYLYLTNIKTSLSFPVSSKLTQNTLFNLCKECINTGSRCTITLHRTPKNTLNGMYVVMSGTSIPKGQKGTVSLATSGTSGAIKITEYLKRKNWYIN